MIGEKLAAGSDRELQVELPAIEESGRYRVVLDLVSEDVTWFADVGSEAVELLLEVEDPRR